MGPSGLEVKTKGKWIPIGKQDATQLGLTCDAVAVEYQITDMVKLPSMEKISEGEATVLRDTMFIVPSPKEGVGFLFKSDLVELFKDVNPKLHEISIPGTHDSFTYNLSKVTGLWGKTQVFDLEQQFDAGVRYFDFRLGGMNVSNLGFYHGFLCCEITLPKALDKLRELLKKHLGETVIAMLKFEYGGINEDRINLLKSILDNYKDILVDPSKFGPDMRYNDCKGKILLMHMATRKDLLLKNFQDASNMPSDRPDTWHLNKTSGYTLNGVVMSYARNAYHMNKYALDYISEHLGEKTGWVVMDYAGLRTEGAIEKTNVHGDELLKILLQNNYAMVKSGVLK